VEALLPVSFRFARQRHPFFIYALKEPHGDRGAFPGERRGLIDHCADAVKQVAVS